MKTRCIFVPGALCALATTLAPAATVEYATQTAGQVSAGIYDQQGCLLRTLQSGKKQEAGRNTVEWDGKEGLGRDLAPGPYTLKGPVANLGWEYQLMMGNAGKPPHLNADGTGGWDGVWGQVLDAVVDPNGNHLYLLWKQEEGTTALIKVDPAGGVGKFKLWGAHNAWSWGNCQTAATDGEYVYVPNNYLTDDPAHQGQKLSRSLLGRVRAGTNPLTVSEIPQDALPSLARSWEMYAHPEKRRSASFGLAADKRHFYCTLRAQGKLVVLDKTIGAGGSLLQTIGRAGGRSLGGEWTQMKLDLLYPTAPAVTADSTLYVGEDCAPKRILVFRSGNCADEWHGPLADGRAKVEVADEAAPSCLYQFCYPDGPARHRVDYTKQTHVSDAVWGYFGVADDRLKQGAVFGPGRSGGQARHLQGKTFLCSFGSIYRVDGHDLVRSAAIGRGMTSDPSVGDVLTGLAANWKSKSGKLGRVPFGPWLIACHTWRDKNGDWEAQEDEVDWSTPSGSNNQEFTHNELILRPYVAEDMTTYAWGNRIPCQGLDAAANPICSWGKAERPPGRPMGVLADPKTASWFNNGAGQVPYDAPLDLPEAIMPTGREINCYPDPEDSSMCWACDAEGRGKGLGWASRRIFARPGRADREGKWVWMADTKAMAFAKPSQFYRPGQFAGVVTGLLFVTDWNGQLRAWDKDTGLCVGSLFAHGYRGPVPDENLVAVEYNEARVYLDRQNGLTYATAGDGQGLKFVQVTGVEWVERFTTLVTPGVAGQTTSAASSPERPETGWRIGQLPAGNYHNLMAVQFVDAERGWLCRGAGDPGPLHSADGGATWHAPESFPADLTQLEQFGLWFGSAWVGYVGMARGEERFLSRTTGGGRNWPQVQIPKELCALKTVWFADEQHGWLGPLWVHPLLCRTDDGGQTCKVVDLRPALRAHLDNPNQWQHLAFDTEHLVVAAERGLVSRSENGGRTWRTCPTGVRNDLTGVAFTSLTQGWATGMGLRRAPSYMVPGCLRHTTGGGLTWKNEGVTGSCLHARFFLGPGTAGPSAAPAVQAVSPPPWYCAIGAPDRTLARPDLILSHFRTRGDLMTKTTSARRSPRKLSLRLPNGFELEFRLRNGYLLGLSAVRFEGRDLRNPAHLLRPYLQSIDGLVYNDWELRRVQAQAECVKLVMRVQPSDAPELEWQDCFNHEHVTTPRALEALAPAEFIWEVGAYSQEVYGKRVPGFYSRYRLKTEAEFHCFIETGTWEIDRLEKPVTVLAQRAGSVPWESRVGKKDGFYTHEAQDCGETNSPLQRREGVAPPGETILWQMMPRAAGSQTFDFQATREGWIALYSPVPCHIQACQRKAAGEETIAHLERHYFPRQQGVDSGRKVVLAWFPEGGTKPEQVRDDWSDVYDTVNGLWRGHYGYREDVPATAYSPTMWAGVLTTEPLAYRRVLDMIPRLAEYGVQRIYPGIWWKMHFTEQISDRAICHVLEYVKSDKYGGNGLLKEMCDRAHEHGMEVFVWVLGAVSRLSPMHRGHSDWICYDRNSQPTAGLFHPTLYCMDYNTGWADYFAETLLRLREECGFDGLFVDSYHNLNFQPLNYHDPLLRTNMPGLIAWQKRMREAGLGFMIETQGIFGVSLNWLDRGRLKTEAQAGVEHTFYKNMVCVKTQWIQEGRIDETFCYRTTANNAPMRLETDFSTPEALSFPDEAWTGFLARINRDYLAVRDRMIRRRTLPGDRGVEWLDDKRERVLALWSFADFSYQPPAGSRLVDVTQGGEVSLEQGKARVRRLHTYRVEAT